MPDEGDGASEKNNWACIHVNIHSLWKGSLWDADIEDIEDVCCSGKSARLQPIYLRQNQGWRQWEMSGSLYIFL